MISIYALDSEEADQYASIGHDTASLYEEDGSGLVGKGVTEEVKDMQKALNSSSLSFYTLKSSKLLTQVFENNSTAQDNLFKNMCNFGSREEWRKEGIVVSYYLDVDTTKDQCRLLNTTPLDCITGYIMEDSVGERALNRLRQRRLNFIYGYISSYCSIINSTKRLEHIRQANKFASILCDLESDRMREKEEKKKIAMEVEENRRQKSE